MKELWFVIFGCNDKTQEFQVTYKTGFINPIDDITECVENIVEVDFPDGNFNNMIHLIGF